MPAFKVESKRIGAHDYKVTQLNAVTGRRVFTRLFKLVGPAMAKTEGRKGDDALAAAMTGLLEHLSEDDVDYFCDVFSAVTSVSGGAYSKAAPQLADVFLSHFAGEYLAMMQWLAFCMQVNFRSFFAGAGRAIGQLVASDSSSPTVSTGGSGDSA